MSSVGEMAVQKPVAVCLVSGGMDSCVSAAIAAQSYRLAFMHANYGQRTEKKELQSFRALAEHFHAVASLVVDFTHVAVIGGTSLIEDGRSGDVPRAGPDIGAHIPSTYVPFRNGLLLSAAAAWAEVLGASAIFFGAVAQDSSGYPDCRTEFVAAMTAAIRAGTKPSTDIRIITPLIHMSKADIVARGSELAAPLHLTWSCYSANETACGVCESCALRLRGFEQAGKKDPIAYD